MVLTQQGDTEEGIKAGPFQNVAQMSPEEIARRRAEFDKQKEVAKTIREEVGVQRATA